MDSKQPEPGSKQYLKLITEIEDGTIKIPKFQRDFVWNMKATASLLDSILKGYPIGTFIFWNTDQQMNGIKNIGNLELSDAPKGTNAGHVYVLDGQQRITSLYAAYKGAKIKRSNYRNIFVNLDKDINKSDGQIVTSERVGEKCISLYEVLNYRDYMKEHYDNYSEEQMKTIGRYYDAFNTYEFSTIVLSKYDIYSAIEVFDRINTKGQKLALFEVMAAKTYDEEQNFDMRDKWDELIEKLGQCSYKTVSPPVILYLLSLILSSSKECKRSTILELKKQAIIDNWDSVVSALKDSIDYFRSTYEIPDSGILPYDVILIPFAYFFYKNKNQPNSFQRKALEEYFWCASLSERYSKSSQTRLAQDIKRIGEILNNVYPEYKEIKAEIRLDSPQSLIDTPFKPGSSYCKAILCLLASKKPKDFQYPGKVMLDNSYLKEASSKNYHHFFPRAGLQAKGIPNENSLMNITCISDRVNKKIIGSKWPSNYISECEKENDKMEETLNSHFIKRDGFGIENDDYDTFLNARAKWIYEELKSRINPDHDKPIE